MINESYVPVPKDLSKIKKKLVFGLTKRQLVGLAAAAVFGLPVFFFISRLSEDLMLPILVLFAICAPIIFVINRQRDDMPSEEWFKNWLYFKALSQKERKYIMPSLGKKDIKKRALAKKTVLKKEKAEEKRQREESGAYYAFSKEKNVTILTVAIQVFKKLLKKIRKIEIEEVSVQDTLKYEEMYKNGICRISKNTFSKTICYEDINYQLVHREEQQKIFSNYCSFLNSFEESVRVQLTFINELAGLNSKKSVLYIEMQDDGHNEIRKEYQDMLRDQSEKGNSGIVRRKYITFTIEARGVYEAKQRLHRIENDAIIILKSMQVKAFPISGSERLKIMHKILNDKNSKFKFSWEKQKKYALNTQDFIAPKQMSFKDKRFCTSGKKYIQTQFMTISASELGDMTLSDFLDIEAELLVNIHIQPVEQQSAIKALKGKSTDVDAMKIEEQKKAMRGGWDMDVLPPDLNTFSEETKEILRQLQNENEKWYNVTVLVTNISKNKGHLDNESRQAKSIALKRNCDLKPYDYNQENCLLSALPLGINETYPRRGLTTQATAIFVPFTTQEIFMEGKSLYYGLNALSGNMIMANRKELDNPNGIIIGVPGSGKSMSAKREMSNVFLITDDNIIVCDPEGEYSYLVWLLGGQVIDISQSSTQHINPLDINANYAEDADPIAFKTAFVLSMMELICGGKTGLTAVEISIIDKCTRKIYEKYIEEPIPENIPVLEDLYNALKELETQESDWLASALEIYVSGSLKMFNRRTNVNVRNRFVCYNIKNITKTVKKLAMLIIQDQVWNTVTENRTLKKSTWYYIDEFHLLLRDQQTAEYSMEIFKRFRKWGGIPTAITQNVKDLLINSDIENILDNSEFVYMLKQAPGDREILEDRLKLSAQQLSHIDNSEPGCGLMKHGSVILPFKDKFPADTQLYKVMTTKPTEAIAS